MIYFNYGDNLIVFRIGYFARGSILSEELIINNIIALHWRKRTLMRVALFIFYKIPIIMKVLLIVRIIIWVITNNMITRHLGTAAGI